MIALLGGALTAALLFAGYGALAVRGVRTLERERNLLDALDTGRRTEVARLAARAAAAGDAEVVQAGTKALAAEHRDRLAVLQRHCHRVLAVDPGVRSLRSAVCDAIRFDRHVLADDPSGGAIGGGWLRADRALRRELKQWRLQDGDPPDVAAFTADAPFTARLSRMADEPVGARLLTRRGDTVEIVDIDANTHTALSSDRVTDAAVVGDWVAVMTESDTYAYDAHDLSHRRRLLPYASSLVPSPDTKTMWVATADGFSELDRSGEFIGQVFQPGDQWLIAASSRYLVTVQDTVDAATLWDRETQRQVRRLVSAGLLALRGDLIVWADPDGTIQSTRPALVFDPAAGHPLAAAIDPTGTQVATVSQDGGRTTLSLSKPDGTVSTSLPIAANQVAWSTDGRWIFACDGIDIVYADAVTLRNRTLRLNREGRQLIAAL